MADIIRRMVWFAIVSTIVFFVLLVFVGKFAAASVERPLPITDFLSPGAHHFRGIIVLPLSCDEVSVQVNKIAAQSYGLSFETWQDPSIPCPAEPTAREFEAVAFAPATGVDFSATLDGNSFPVVIIPQVATPAS